MFILSDFFSQLVLVRSKFLRPMVFSEATADIPLLPGVE
jgi:hypothetical protein